MSSTSLYKRLKGKGYSPNCVAEVDVYYPETSVIYDYIVEGIDSILVEADPDIAKIIREKFSSYGNVLLYEVAVYDSDSEIELVKSGASSFVSSIYSSPAKINDELRIENSVKSIVKATTFDKLDNGKIDLLSIDIEGCEWFVLKNLKSQPTVISVETHGGIYQNPFYFEIKKWFSKNNYILWYKTKSDSIYVKNGSIIVSIFDRFNLFLTELKILFFKIKKMASKKIKGAISKVNKY